MIFFLASLPNETYKVLQEVYQQYEGGKLVRVPKSKCSSADVKLDCRGSNFKGLRNLDNHIVTDILKKMANKDIPFTTIGSYCKEIKNMRQLKEEFT